jgi:DNA polymerase III, delta subunit
VNASGAEIFAGVVGHERPRAFLEGVLRTRRVPTGFLFHGPAGRGKRLIAQHFMRQLLGDPACRLENHPDFDLVTAPEGKALIPIERLRDLREWFSRKPFQADRRVALVDEAQRMTVEAQNSLLKLLEEPPQGGHLILVAAEPAGLLETIHSRLQRIYFGPLRGEAAVALVAREAGVDPALAAQCLALAQGSPGLAMELARDGMGESGPLEEVAALLDPRRAPFETAERFFAPGHRRAPAAAREALLALFDLAVEAIGDGAVAEARGEEPRHAVPVAARESILNQIFESRRRVMGNVAPRLVLESLKIEIARAHAAARAAR